MSTEIIRLIRDGVGGWVGGWGGGGANGVYRDRQKEVKEGVGWEWGWGYDSLQK